MQESAFVETASGAEPEAFLEPQVLASGDGRLAIRFALRAPAPDGGSTAGDPGPGLSSLVWDVCRSVAGRLPGPLRIEVFAEPDEGPLAGDSAALARALDAVLRHAVRLLGARSGWIEVRTAARRPDAPRVEVSVQGVSEAQLPAMESRGGAGETAGHGGGGAPEVGARHPVSPAVPPELTPAAGCPPSEPRSRRLSRDLRPPSS